MTFTVAPLGDLALRLQVDGDPLAVARRVLAADLDGIVDVLPAAETLVVTVAETADLGALWRRLETMSGTAEATAPVVTRGSTPDTVEIAVSVRRR